MAVTFRGAPAANTGNATSSLTVTGPGSSTGEPIMITLFANKAYDTTVSTKSGFTAGATGTNGTVSSSNQNGSVRCSAFWRELQSADTSSTWSPWTSSTNVTVYASRAILFDKGATEEWTIESTFGSDTDDSGTSVSATGADNINLTAGDWITVLVAHRDGSTTHASQSVSVPGCTLGSFTWLDTGTTSGDDISIFMGRAQVSSGTQTGAPSYTATASTNGRASASVIFVRVHASVPATPSEGSASGDVSVTGSATGDEPPLEGAATGDVAITGSATGERPPLGEGSATGDMAFTGVAIGDMPPDVKTGTASLTLSIEPEASGVRDSSGEADPGSLDVTGSAEGGMPKYGDATGSLDVTGSATGTRVSKGIITPQDPNLSLFSNYGDVVGDAPGVGYVTTSTGLFAALHIGHNVAAGNKRNGKVVAGGNAVRIESSSVVGAQGTSYRSGSATGDVAVTGSASGAMPFYGDATGSLTITGSASGDVPDNTGSVTGSVTVTGSASGEREPLGSATGALDVTSTASGESAYAGSVTGSLTITCTTAGDVPPNDGSASGTATITAGTVDGRRPHKGSATAGFDGIALKIEGFGAFGEYPPDRTGSVSGSMVISGTAEGRHPLRGSTSGAVTISGSVVGGLPRYGSSSGSVTVTGTVTDRKPSRGSALGPANQAPALIVLLGEASGSAPEPGEGSASGSLSIAGDAVPGVRDPVGSVTESVTITGSATGNIDPNLGSSTGSYSLVGSASGKKVQKAVAVGSYSYSGTSTGTRTPKAAATGGYVFTGGGVSATYRAGQATGTVNVAGTATGRRDLLADVTLVLDRGPYGNDLAARIQPRRTVAIDGPWGHALAPALQPRRALRVGHPQQKQISIRSKE